MPQIYSATAMNTLMVRHLAAIHLESARPLVRYVLAEDVANA